MNPRELRDLQFYGRLCADLPDKYEVRITAESTETKLSDAVAWAVSEIARLSRGLGLPSYPVGAVPACSREEAARWR